MKRITRTEKIAYYYAKVLAEPNNHDPFNMEAKQKALGYGAALGLTEDEVMVIINKSVDEKLIIKLANAIHPVLEELDTSILATAIKVLTQSELTADEIEDIIAESWEED